MKRLLSLGALLALAACATPLLNGTPVRSDGLARLGEPTCIGALVVTPQSVIEDSRCPINARCVWAGRLVLAARIDGQGWVETARLTLRETYETHGAGVVLVSAQPGKLAGASPPASPTLFGFESR